MNENELKLTEEAIAALKAGRTIEAIKLTRVSHHLGLKEAKDQVQAYLLQHPEIVVPKPQVSQEAIMRFMIVLVGAALLLWLFYQH